ncbi:MAG: YgiT-type zinc finger protein [Acidobacteriales bacterium]|nr:YgiT-type zinc finger protein [Terriglobales bacterium]
MDIDFCEYCNAPLPANEKLVTVHRHRDGQHFIFERVPAYVCPRCGERYFSALAVREMDRLMREPSALNNLIPIPVIELKLAL